MSELPEAANAELQLALRYAPRDGVPGLQALFALDQSLAQILRTTREPMVGQMRLTWWHDALTRLDTAPPPAEPVLRALAGEVLPLGVSGDRLSGLVEGWEELLDAEPLNDEAAARHAALRGSALFEMAGTVVGAASDPLTLAGRGWALVGLARHLSDRAAAERALAAAAAPLAQATEARWSRQARALGALAHLARMDAAVPLGEPIPAGAPRRIARLLWHRLSGR